MKPGALKSEFLLEDSCHRIYCFLFFFQHLPQSFWLLIFVVNQLYSQKRSPKFSKAKFRSKTVSTIIAAFFSSFNIFSNRFVKNCGENVMFEEKVTFLSFYCKWEKVFLVLLKTCYKKWFVGFQRRSSIINVCVDRRLSMFVDRDHDLIDRQS